jgi:DNA-binding HxlR family transcriptional regulator
VHGTERGRDRRSRGRAVDAGSQLGAKEGERDPLARALQDVGDRWTLLIVSALLGGPRRFNDLQEEVAGIASNVLTRRLSQLEERALVVASAYSQRPPRYVYELTRGGQDLAGALVLLRSWGSLRDGVDAGAAAPEHSACGSRLEARWWCPTCDRVAEEGDEGSGTERLRYL